MAERKLMALEQYNNLGPWSQGYATYMQAEWPGSELPKTNPYAEGTREHQSWADGATRASIDVQDSEED